MKKHLTNFWLHFIIMAICTAIMVTDVISTGSNSLSEMTPIGMVAGYIFTVDLGGFVLYTFYMMIFKR